jgi:hypothetical protein
MLYCSSWNEFVAELDRKIIAVKMLAYLMFPSTFEKHEHALLLFTLLLEKNMSLNAIPNSTVENKDSG